MAIRCISMDSGRMWGEDMGLRGKGENRGNIGKIPEMGTGVKWRTPGYMVREELHRKKIGKTAIRAWRFKKRMEEGKRSELARICWEEMRGRARRGRELSGWEKERREFFSRMEMGIEEVKERREREREGRT